MKSIGIRELRQHASKYLAMVKAGESIEVTERGEPIAMITPIKKRETVLERLQREGRIIEPTAPRDLSRIELHPPKPGVPLPSELVEADRTSERV